jgi:hypothetical protein
LPIVRTLSEDALRARREGLLGRVARRASAMMKVRGGYRLEFTAEPDTLSLLAAMIDAERQCCRFLGFDLRVEPDVGPIAWSSQDRRARRPSGSVTRDVVTLLSTFGLFAVTAMLVTYALEQRSHWFVLAFAAACALGSVYGFLQVAWPFGLVEAIWSIVAVRRWWEVRSKSSS